MAFTATHDGNGVVTLYGGTATHDGNGVVTLTMDAVVGELGEAIASAQITVYRTAEVESVQRYYKLGTSAPSVPTSETPSGWTTSEPAYTAGDTNNLYFVDLTKLTDGSWLYSDVSLSSSYEAAKQAYIKAQNAQNTVDNLEVGGRNLVRESSLSKDTDLWHYDTDRCSVSFEDGYFEVSRETSTDYTSKVFHTQYSSENSQLMPDIISGETFTLSADFKAIDGIGISVNSCIFFRVYYGTQYEEVALTFKQGMSSTEWTRLSVTKTFGTKAWTESQLSIAIANSNNGICIKNVKLEKGNKPTDWTPAPEDMVTSEELDNTRTGLQESIDGVSGSIEDLNETVNSQDKLIAQHTESIATITNDQGVITETFNTKITEITESIDGKISAAVTEREKFIRREDGNIILGEKTVPGEDNFQLVLANKQISFQENQADVAWITGRKLHIQEAEIHNTIKLGQFEFTIHGPNNNLGIRRITG